MVPGTGVLPAGLRDLATRFHRPTPSPVSDFHPRSRRHSLSRTDRDWTPPQGGRTGTTLYGQVASLDRPGATV